MADYIYIPNGQKVQAADGKAMPPALFKPLEEPKKTTRKRAAKPKE